MLGVEDYGSDNDSDNETTATSTTTTNNPPSSVTQKKSAFSLPPPTNTNYNTAGPSTIKSNGLSLPPPKATRRAPKKIAIGLPSLPDVTDEDVREDERPLKKPRLEAGAGFSGLLSVLPAPKNINPVAPQRVLGGGRGPGLVFNNTSRRATVEDVSDGDEDNHPPTLPVPLESLQKNEAKPIPFLPPHLAKGKSNISTEDTPARSRPSQTASAQKAPDFFSIGSSTSQSSASRSASTNAASSSSTLSMMSGVSSAPKVDEFVPPEPSRDDPYPGYYLLPNGSWAAYDQDYYRTFYDNWKRDYDSQVRALEKGIEKGFEGAEEAAQEFNAQREMEKAKVEIQEREEKKALTAGAVGASDAPKMNIKGAALGGRARTRHQLSTLLTEAYQNREALEDRIAQGRRNRKEAGNKYGF